MLLAHLKDRHVRVHDPVVAASIVPFATGCATPLECAEGVDALVIATPWPQFRDLPIAELKRRMAGRILVDPYRLLDGHAAAAAGFSYYALGMSALEG
jgi:UDPglucose 6-dehydrogenase